MFKQIIFCSVLTVALLMTTVSLALAQNAAPTLISTDTAVSAEAELDSIVSADELGLSEPSILPDSPFYFLKNWSRSIRSAITFNKVKKAELNLKYASERLLEARKLALKDKNEEVIEKAAEKYEQALDKIKQAVDKIKDTASTNDKVDKFLDKYTQQETLHLKILDKLKDQVPENAVERIASTTDRHLENFKEVMLKLEDKSRIGQRLEKNLQKLKGSELKDVKNLEILKRIEDKLPEDAQETVQQVREKITNQLQEKLEKAPPAIQEKVEGYFENISGEAERKIEILEDLRLRLKNNVQIREKLEGAAEKVTEQVRERVQAETGRVCPVDMINPNSCNGRVVTYKDKSGCPRTKCVELGETWSSALPNNSADSVISNADTACIAVWDPVCGSDGKTYSNKCYANAAGTQVVSKGACVIKQVKPKLITPDSATLTPLPKSTDANNVDTGNNQ